MKKRINKRAYKMRLYREKNHVDFELYKYIQDMFGEFGDSWVIWIMKLYGSGKWKDSDATETYYGIDGLHKLYNDGFISSEMMNSERYDSVNSLLVFVNMKKGEEYNKKCDIEYNSRFKFRIGYVHPQYYYDYYVFYYDSEWLVIVPLSYKGSRMWGYDTKWCTSSSNGNEIFNYYDEQGSIFINIKLDGLLEIDKSLMERIDFCDIVKSHVVNRFQLHFESEQCMDEDDKPIKVLEKYNGILSLGLVNKYKEYCSDKDALYQYWLLNFCVCDIDEISNIVRFINRYDKENVVYEHEISECNFLIRNDVSTLIIKNPTTNKESYLTKDYKVMFPGKWWNKCYHIDNNIGVVSEYKLGYTYINDKGEHLFPGKYWHVCIQFRDGIGIVTDFDKGDTYINIQGEYLFPGKYWDCCFYFCDGIARVYLDGKGYTYINDKGEYLFPGKWWFENMDFSEGKAGVSRNTFNFHGDCIYPENSWTYINLQGEYIFPDKHWKLVTPFNDNKAIVGVKGKGYTYINDKGEYLFPDKYWKTLSLFSNGYSAVKIDDNKCTFINDKGEYIFPGKYWDTCSLTNDGRLIVYINDEAYFIDNVTGEIIDKCYL